MFLSDLAGSEPHKEVDVLSNFGRVRASWRGWRHLG